MIIKSKGYKRTSDVQRVLNYIAQEHKTRSGDYPLLLTRNLGYRPSQTAITRAILQGHQNRIHKRKNANIFYQEILSFHKDDSLSIDTASLKDLARHYTKHRAPNSYICCTLHQDTDHLHLHFMVSATEVATGKSNRLSRDAFVGLKLEMERYQDKNLSLVHSKVNHLSGGSFDPNKSYIRLPHQLSTIKEQIHKNTLEALKNCSSLEEFKTNLVSSGYQVYYRSGRLYGVVCQNRKYRFKTLGLNIDSIEAKLLKTAQLESVQDKIFALRSIRNQTDNERNYER